MEAGLQRDILLQANLFDLNMSSGPYLRADASVGRVTASSNRLRVRTTYDAVAENHDVIVPGYGYGPGDGPVFDVYAEAWTAGLVPLFNCRMASSSDTFVSASSDCEGRDSVRVAQIGFVWSAPSEGVGAAIRRCVKTESRHEDHFVTLEPDCEGATSDGILGYAVR